MRVLFQAMQIEEYRRRPLGLELDALNDPRDWPIAFDTFEHVLRLNGGAFVGWQPFLSSRDIAANVMTQVARLYLTTHMQVRVL